MDQKKMKPSRARFASPLCTTMMVRSLDIAMASCMGGPTERPVCNLSGLATARWCLDCVTGKVVKVARSLAGRIFKARLYDHALDSVGIMASYQGSAGYISDKQLFTAMGKEQREQLVDFRIGNPAIESRFGSFGENWSYCYRILGAIWPRPCLTSRSLSICSKRRGF